MTHTAPSSRNYLSIRAVLLLISLVFLLLPLGSLYFLRIYESALIRQTESELISQAAFIAALYKQEVKTLLALQHKPIQSYGLPAVVSIKQNGLLSPIFPTLDFAKSPVYPVRPAPYDNGLSLDSVATHAGREIMPVLQEAQRITLSGIRVLDYQGLVAAGREEVGLSFAHTEEFRQAIHSRPVSLLRRRSRDKQAVPLGSISRNSDVNVYVALPVILEQRLIGMVWVNRTPTDLSQALYNKRYELIWTGLLLMVVALLISALTSLTITRPIQALVNKTRQIESNDPAGLEPLNHPVTREINQLSQSVSAMANTIQQRTDYIRTFTSHVSHEFKTPLTAIQGSVELLQENLAEMSAEQQQRFLANIAEDTDRLKRLVNRLMELSRADIIPLQTELVELGPILISAQLEYASDAFHVDLPSDVSGLKVLISADSLEAVLGNLLNNSRQAGATQVTIQVEPYGSDHLHLLVQDNGPGISEANRDSIFTPFFTTHRDHGGTGLGLSISRTLIERQGGQLELLPGEQGACFRVQLPTI